MVAYSRRLLKCVNDPAICAEVRALIETEDYFSTVPGLLGVQETRAISSSLAERNAGLARTFDFKVKDIQATDEAAIKVQAAALRKPTSCTMSVYGFRADIG